MPNPYDPQTPARPEYFGGREHVLRRLRERIDIARTHLKSGGVLIYGHRGVGKTSLINKIVSELSNNDDVTSDILIINRRLGRTTNDQELYRLLNEELRAQVDKRLSLIEKFKKIGGQISGLKAFDFQIDLNKQSTDQTPYNQWRTYLDNLNNVKLVFVAIDDADFLSLEAIGELKTIVEEVSKIPVLLTISGFMDFEEKLVDKYSPVARIFSGASFNIGRFDINETKEVLIKPLQNEKTTWSENAIQEVHNISGGYPYLVQCIASASYKEGTNITKEKILASVNHAVDIGKSWLDHEIPDASDEDVRSFARIASLNKDIIQSIEMSRVGVSPPYIGRLVKLRILRPIRRGKYSLEKSPMIATFELLKRGLDEK